MFLIIWKIIIEKNLLTVDTNIGEMEPSISEVSEIYLHQF